MGESKLKLARREEMLLSCAGVQTMAGRVQVRWQKFEILPNSVPCCIP